MKGRKPKAGVNNVTAGKHLPEEFSVIIEIPMTDDPIKYQVDENSGASCVGRSMMTKSWKRTSGSR